MGNTTIGFPKSRTHRQRHPPTLWDRFEIFTHGFLLFATIFLIAMAYVLHSGSFRRRAAVQPWEVGFDLKASNNAYANQRNCQPSEDSVQDVRGYDLHSWKDETPKMKKRNIVGFEIPTSAEHHQRNRDSPWPSRTIPLDEGDNNAQRKARAKKVFSKKYTPWSPWTSCEANARTREAS